MQLRKRKRQLVIPVWCAGTDETIIHGISGRHRGKPRVNRPRREHNPEKLFGAEESLGGLFDDLLGFNG
jgi:hypothetical protein